ncbi:MAG: hypothetical protein ACI85F_002897 [Bacteroidia bacterium]|jgi:hypothetical protein
MGMSITDIDRLNTLNMLFIQEGKTDAHELPFSRNKLDYLRPLMVRLNQVSSKVNTSTSDVHSSTMLRQMIDELLLEITAQVNWSIGSKRTTKRKRIISEYGLILWNQFANPVLSTTAKVA